MDERTPQDIELRLATRADRDRLEELYSAHLHVLARTNPLVDPTVRLQSDWFEKPQLLFPWAIVRAGRIVGFALVGGAKLAAAFGSDADLYLHEFHVAEHARRTGLGTAALTRLFARQPGRWCIDVDPRNERAMAFWAKALEPYAPDYTTHVEADGARFVRHSFVA